MSYPLEEGLIIGSVATLLVTVLQEDDLPRGSNNLTVSIFLGVGADFIGDLVVEVVGPLIHIDELLLHHPSNTIPTNNLGEPQHRDLIVEE